MIRITDILLNIFLFLLFAISTMALIGFGIPYLCFIPIILFAALQIYRDNKKRIMKYIADDFKNLGYDLLTERAYKFSESKITFRIHTGAKINNIPIERFYYVVMYKRVFTAKANDGNTYTLFTRITKEWNGTNTIEILDKQIIS